MNLIRTVPLLAAWTLAAALWAGPDRNASGRTEVTFDHPENFTDVRDNANPTDAGRNRILEAFSRYIATQARYYLPTGYVLSIRFTDIKLAGDYEPWRGVDWDHIRVVKDIYFPAFKFTYAVRDASGKVVRQGSENIRDMDFMMRPVLDTNDPLRYEKDVLADWMRSKLRDLRH